MVTAAAGTERTTGEDVDKSKRLASDEHTDAGLSATRRGRPRAAQPADLAGFIGDDVWMVGKYER